MKIYFINNAGSKAYLVDENATLKSSFEALGINATGTVSVNGEMLHADDFNSTYKELGIEDESRFASIVKTGNGNK